MKGNNFCLHSFLVVYNGNRTELSAIWFHEIIHTRLQNRSMILDPKHDTELVYQLIISILKSLFKKQKLCF